MFDNDPAEEITKEEAAKFIKQLQREERQPAISAATANMIQTLFMSVPEQDLSDIDLAPGEADEILTDPFEAEDFGL